MSKQVFTQVIRGAHQWVKQAEEGLEKALAEHGPDKPVGWGPLTAYNLPMSYSLMGLEAKTLGDLRPQVEHARELLKPVPSDDMWLPYLGDGLDAGAATMLAQEALVALRTLNGHQMPPGWQGFISDTIMRELGIQLVDGRMPGFAAILGPAPTTEIAVKVVRDLQERSILAFLCANRDGKTMREQMVEGGVLKEDASMEECWDLYVVPVGPDTLDAIYVLNWSIRSALTFGGHKRGEARKCLDYTKRRINAFGITFGEIPDDWYATGAGAILMGYPVISDSTTTPEIRPTGVTVREEIVVETDFRKLVPTCIDTRAVKVKIEKIDVPVGYAAAFEGERVRKDDMHVQFGYKYSDAVEYARMVEPAEIQDGDVQLAGPDIDSVEAGGAMPLSIEVLIAGRKMQRDFEGIMERQIHRWTSHAMGFMHTGQRDQIWCRISRKAFGAGFRLRHLGTILHAKLHDEYGGIVDKVAVRLCTEADQVKAKVEEAREAFAYRDDRIAGMTDESVDVFYSCTICQSYAPDHVCVITPQRLGLCGAYNWLDGRANYEISPAGPNQPITKGRTIDHVKGEWEGVNKFVYENSNRKVERFCAYSLLEEPMTSCGCFECIVAILPMANGVMVVNREFQQVTPSGMSFGELASVTGGGAQTPGFLGVGRLYLSSPKFLSADGGVKRIVWMPKALKEGIRERFQKEAGRVGEPDLLDKIATEEEAATEEEVAEYLAKVNHPAVSLDPLM
ncbi:MAG: CO dehydrogenase/CO-methylating acetyl-CoA synthase complex subunit beta [Planctomycetes bacterium RBG_13_63_9]|nr:MAG: CO dehydrogenase/CO-methylating acetyl-CoA synthase complex subunit beta [Planctomycetes bacterium RBG_13_63_9]